MAEDIRVLVVDESPGLAQGLLHELPGDPDGEVRVLGPVPDAPSALRRVDVESINLILVDLDREDGFGVETVRLIREGTDSARVLGVTSEHGPDLAAGAIAAGACGVVSIEPVSEELISAFRRALAGELVLPAVHLSSLVDRLRDGREDSEASRLESLTGRETEILRALADGRATLDIARLLGISPMTVQSHVKNILAKLGVHSKVEAVTLAWRFGLGSTAHSA
jgi:DNA-binding NarL/FixJ family response regulator